MCPLRLQDVPGGAVARGEAAVTGCWYIDRPTAKAVAELGNWPQCPEAPTWRLGRAAVSCDEHAIHRDHPGLWEFIGEVRQGVLL